MLFKGLITTLALAVPLTLASAGSAAAAEPSASVSVAPNVARPGETVRASVSCTNGTFASLASPAIEAFNNDHAGVVRADIAPGEYTVTLTCTASDLVALNRTATATTTLRVRTGGADGRFSCADYARLGVFDIVRGDPRYRAALDVDGDGLACERNGDDDRSGLPGRRDCQALRDARDEADRRILEANQAVTEAQATSSAEGAALSTSEREAVDSKVATAQAAIKKLNDARETPGRRCEDATLTHALLPIPGEPAPPASARLRYRSGTSNDTYGASRTPGGTVIPDTSRGVDTGDGSTDVDSNIVGSVNLGGPLDNPEHPARLAVEVASIALSVVSAAGATAGYLAWGR